MIFTAVFCPHFRIRASCSFVFLNEASSPENRGMITSWTSDSDVFGHRPGRLILIRKEVDRASKVEHPNARSIEDNGSQSPTAQKQAIFEGGSKGGVWQWMFFKFQRKINTSNCFGWFIQVICFKYRLAKMKLALLRGSGAGHGVVPKEQPGLVTGCGFSYRSPLVYLPKMQLFNFLDFSKLLGV